MLQLPREIAEACAELFAAHPLQSAMPMLRGASPVHTERVETIVRARPIADHPELAAALWLYVDDLYRSHVVAQSLPDPTGAYWHGIMHRREGDFANSRYWMRRAASHPLLRDHPELDPVGLVNAVEEDAGANAAALVERQRQEWRLLFEWCASQALRR